MKFAGVRLLVNDYKKCFDFYTERLGFEVVFNIDNCYGSFKVADNIEGFAIFTSDLMAPLVGNADKNQPICCREKSMISFEVENVDDAYRMLLSRDVEFINQPIDMPDWGMRMVHFRDPEENLIELYTPLH